MARITKTAAAKSAAAASKAVPAAKVGKLDKAAKAAPAAKPAKAAPAEKAASAPRGQYVGQTIRLTETGKAESPARGDALVRFQAITRHKKTDDALGFEYQTSAGETRKIVSADIAYLVKRGLIEVA